MYSKRSAVGPRGRLAAEQVRQLCAAPNLWVRLLTWATYPEHCDPAWRDALRKEIEDFPNWPAAASYLKKLDSDRFAEREQASEELTKLGSLAEPAILAYMKGELSPEAHHRCERLLDQCRRAGPDANSQGTLAVLGDSTGKEATRILEKLARGESGAWVTDRARKTLEDRFHQAK